MLLIHIFTIGTYWLSTEAIPQWETRKQAIRNQSNQQDDESNIPERKTEGAENNGGHGETPLRPPSREARGSTASSRCQDTVQSSIHIGGAQSVFREQINDSTLPVLSLVSSTTSDNCDARSRLSSAHLRVPRDKPNQICNRGRWSSHGSGGRCAGRRGPTSKVPRGWHGGAHWGLS